MMDSGSKPVMHLVHAVVRGLETSRNPLAQARAVPFVAFLAEWDIHYSPPTRNSLVEIDQQTS